ncbi:radical SAM protein [Streptacidiphilus sp. N1-10]|uniref:Radical SAM protein n=1 Tax=Streptacidiphilus jeojiensis TaxID=3229225 RepID=A0ABV6XNH0_9ACTN
MTTTIEPQQAASTTTRFLALDLTRKCQAKCAHGYNQSGPSGTHGDIAREDWLNVLGHASRMGVTRVQFIGGEVTLHPDLADLINYALELGTGVEVFSNLIDVRDVLWPVLRQRGVSLATSYYSDRADEHEKITQHRGAYLKTKANIEKSITSYQSPPTTRRTGRRPGA